MRVHYESKGNFNTTLSWLKKSASRTPTNILNQIGRKGVSALQQATPIRSGETAAGWKYKLKQTARGYDVIYYNDSHPESSANIAVLIQLGHGTGTGGFVPGIDYINPALKPVFDWGSQALAREMSK